MAENWWHNLPRYLSTGEVSRLLSIGNVSVRSMAERGTIPAPIKLSKTFHRHDKYRLMLVVIGGMTVDEVEAMTERQIQSAVMAMEKEKEDVDH